MRKLERQIPLYLTKELAEWLDGKAVKGYKRAPLIRYILDEYRKAELNGKN